MADLIELLVVSDSPVVRAGLRAILEASGRCRVAAECGLEELVGRSVELRPEMVLLELPAGDPDGVEILWRLAAELPDLGVVVLSDDPSEITAREILQAGARGYLLRDVSPEEIVEAVVAARTGLTVLHPATARAILSPPMDRPSPETGEPLTSREMDVLRLLAQGLPSKTIAARLGISEHTVKFHVGSILGKLGSASRTEAVAVAIRRGLIAL